MAIREKILQLAQKIDGMGSTFTEDDPQYYLLNCVVSDEQAEVALQMERRVPISAEKIAEKCGKTIDETKRLLYELMEIGVIEDTHKNGIEEYVLLIFLPGILENMVLNTEQFEKHPEIARAFQEMSYIPPALAPMIPVGGAGIAMHVIPVETAVPTGTKPATYDQLSYWLKKYNFLAVMDCQCRKTRKYTGEGCGHTIEDTCIYVGDAAEYVVKTNRARRVTYDEALEILKKNEEEGLMHQISNIDGPDEIFTICSCCRCGCLAVKSSQYYNLPNLSRSNFVAKVDPEKCAACGQCVEYCPANAVKLGQSFCMKTPEPIPEIVVLNEEDWGPKYWNLDYRNSRVNVVETGTAPCKAECPAHIAVQGYIQLASQGRYTDALELIKQENPLPAICGRICPHKCESECTRGDLDEAIAIDEIKKFIADRDMDEKHRFIPTKKHNHGKKMAVIGSGPSGLSCAYYLAVDGYEVTVFEKEEKLGGMLMLGIPSFRLEKEVVEAEINILREIGVEFKTGVEIGKHLTIQQLRDEGYEAFYIAIGAQGGRQLGLEGEDAEGVISGIEFLKAINLGEEVVLNGKTIVIGGGNVAIDVARAAVRTKSEATTIYCLESTEEMPALLEEQEEAKAEGVSINNGWGPKKIVVENGKVVGVEFKKCVSVFDDNNTFNPQYDENDTIFAAADNVLISIGQSIEWGNLLEGCSILINPNGTAVADDLTYQTSERDVFVGGDVYTGPKFAIDAIAAGKQAAISMHRAVWPGQSLTIGRDRRIFNALDKENIIVEGYDRSSRQKIGHTSDAKKSFNDVRITFTEEQLKNETSRCLSCGVSIIDEYSCLGCGLCTTKCKFDAITLEKCFDGEYISTEETMSHLQPYVLKLNGNQLIRE